MTGRLLVEQLLAKHHQVRVIVRSPHKFTSAVLDNPNLTIVKASILDLSDEEMAAHVKGCGAIVSCLGHVLDFKGIFGAPRMLCTDAVQRLCEAAEKNNRAGRTKFILMNTVAIQNPDCNEKRTWFDRLVLSLLQCVLPPHKDNEMAAEYLFQNIGKNNRHIDWCSIRPDTLTNAPVSLYEIKASPVTGIFSGRPTARANVARFMVELIEDAGLWGKWKFKMPVIMNSAE